MKQAKLALFGACLMLASCTTMKELACVGESDADFVEFGDEICYKPSYEPSPEALEEAIDSIPDRVRAHEERRIYDRLIERRCTSQCKAPRLEECPTITEFVNIDLSAGTIETREVPDPDCVAKNNATREKAYRSCRQCNSIVDMECLNSGGEVLDECIVQGDRFSERQRSMEIDKREKATTELYYKLLSDDE